MKTTTLTLLKLAIATMVLFPTVTAAKSYYLKPYVGVSQMADQAGTAEGFALQTNTADVELDLGFNAGLSGGYVVNTSLVVELGWEYRSNGSKTNVGSATYPDGNYASNTVYLNGIYQLSAIGDFQPYAGAGFIWVEEVDIDLESNGQELSYSSDGDTGFQLFAGINYPLNPKWVLQLETRYSSIADVSLSGEGQTAGTISKLEYEPVTLQIGAMYRF